MARKRNPIWDALVVTFPDHLHPTGHKTRIGKLVRELKAMDADPVQICVRAQEMRRRFGAKFTATPEALVKHWIALGRQSEPPPHGSRDIGLPVPVTHSREELERMEAEYARRRQCHS